PERRDLAAALKRILDQGWGIDGASDHGTHEAIYMHDPDVEKYLPGLEKYTDERTISRSKHVAMKGRTLARSWCPALWGLQGGICWVPVTGPKLSSETYRHIVK